MADGPGGVVGGDDHDLVDGRAGPGGPPLRPGPHGAAPHPRAAPDQPPHPHGDLDRRVVPLPASRPDPPPLAEEDVLRSPSLRSTLQPPPLLGSRRGGEAVVSAPARVARCGPAAARAGRRSASAGGDLCIQGTTSCAAPWNWFSRYVDQRQRSLVRLFVDPCGRGSLAGGGVVLTKNLSARILFEGGVITAARAASAFEGPPGVALGALAGCMTGVGAKGFHTVSGLLDHLNPFDRGGSAAWLGTPRSAPAGAPRRS